MALILDNHGPADADRDPQLALLYRETAQETPPRHLDAAIQAAARRAAGWRPMFAGSPFRTWRVPVAIAAVVVLSVTLVTLMVEQGEVRLTEAPGGLPSMAPSGKSTTEAPGSAASNLPPKASVSREPVPRPSNPAQKSEQQGSAALAGKPFERKSSTLEENQEPSVAGQIQPPREQSLPLEDRAAVPGVFATRPQSAEAVKRSEASYKIVLLIREYENQPPENWVEKIMELRRHGDTMAATGMLSEFRKRFPTHPLPPGLL